MRSRLARAALAVPLLLTSTACYRAVVETGRPVGTTVVQKSWVNTFVFGLVPAAEIDVSRECPGGVARIETQQTFVNGLVGVLTLGIYTPQSATVTCAAARTGALDPALEARGHAVLTVAADASESDRGAAFRAAAAQSARTGQPVFVHF